MERLKDAAAQQVPVLGNLGAFLCEHNTEKVSEVAGGAFKLREASWHVDRQWPRIAGGA